MAEWSKALASGASPQGRGFEPHSCHFVGRRQAQANSNARSRPRQHCHCSSNDAEFRGSIVVSISACHAEDPGSIPGRGVWRLVDPPCGYPFRPGTTSVAHQLWSSQRPSRNAAPHRSSAWTSLVSKVSKVSNRNHCRSDPVRVQSTETTWHLELLMTESCLHNCPEVALLAETLLPIIALLG